MRTHVTIVGWLLILTNVLWLAIGALIFLAGVGVGVAGAATGALHALPILGGLGFFLGLLFVCVGLPGFLAGIGLLNYAPWARILAIIWLCLHLFAVPPIGTVIAIYGLIILLNGETANLFSGVRPAY